MARPRNPEAREAQRQAILQTARRLFAERGFHQTGMAALCEAVGMSPGGLYRYFRSKRAIIEAIVAAERQDVLVMLDEVKMAKGLEASLVELLDVSAAAAEDPVEVSLWLEVAAEAARDPEVGRLVEDAEREVTSRLTDVLEAARQRGELRSGVDPSTLAAILMAAANGFTMSPAALTGVDEQQRRHHLGMLVRSFVQPVSAEEELHASGATSDVGRC